MIFTWTNYIEDGGIQDLNVDGVRKGHWYVSTVAGNAHATNGRVSMSFLTRDEAKAWLESQYLLREGT